MKKIFCFLVFTVLISFGLHSQMEKQVDLKALDDYFAKMV